MGRWGTSAFVVVGLIGGMLLPAVPAAAVHGAVPGDFNGDGYRDAVLPAPGANVSGKEAAGAVVVLYGSASGLSATRRKTVTQNTSGVPGTAEEYDRFGAATATADLNGWGADLVVTSPYEDTSKGVNSGAVTVLWGSGGNPRWHGPADPGHHRPRTHVLRPRCRRAQHRAGREDAGRGRRIRRGHVSQRAVQPDGHLRFRLLQPGDSLPRIRRARRLRRQRHARPGRPSPPG